ncbi:MAG: excisionase family DNA-binding protein [Propionicimonas sp.]
MAIISGNDSRVMTSAHESDLARSVLRDLEGEAGVLTVEQDGQRRAPLPPEIGRVLQHVISVMARGGSVTVSSVPNELTTTLAAEILGVSRPTLMKMVADGRLASHRVGSHHRLFAEDVFAELRARRARERAAFAALLELEGDEI